MANFWNYAKEHGSSLFQAGSGHRKQKPSKSEEKVRKMLRSQKRSLRQRIRACIAINTDPKETTKLLSLFERAKSELLTVKQRRMLFMIEQKLGISTKGMPPSPKLPSGKTNSQVLNKRKEDHGR